MFPNRHLFTTRLVLGRSTRLETYTPRRFFVSKFSHSTRPEFFRLRPIYIFGILGLALAGYVFLPDASRQAPTSDKLPLSLSHFTPTTLISSESCGPNFKLLTLKISSYLLPPRDSSTFAPVWSVYIKDDDIQVERPYTPLQGVDSEGRMTFWVRKYPNGEVGRWLHSKPVGDTIEIRGPSRTWNWKDDTWDEVVMVSGGTGITPFFQLIHNIVTRGTGTRTHFTLLHSSSTPAELPPSAILGSLQAYAASHPQNFKLHLFVDSESDSSDKGQQYQVGRITKASIEHCLGLNNSRPGWWQKLIGPWSTSPSVRDTSRRKVLFLICGPEAMINAIAGPYGRNFSQGQVGGILRELGYTSDEVWKL